MTLIVCMPCSAGLVVGSDSRQTLDNIVFCDGAEKLLELHREGRLLVAVTGRRGFWPLTIAAAADPCAFVRQNWREFDLGTIVRDHIEANADFDLWQADISVLSRYAGDQLAQYIRDRPNRQPALNGDRFTSSVLLFGFDSEKQLSLIRRFDVSVAEDGRSLKSKVISTDRFAAGDLAEPLFFGEGDYLMQQVLPRLAQWKVSPALQSRLGGFPSYSFTNVGETDLSEAIDIIRDLLTAASELTMTVPAASGIGGPLDIRLLSAEPRPRRIV